MWVEAILTRDDLAKTVNDFCPLKIRLGESGTLLMAGPRDITLIPDVGLRMSVSLEIHWPILGVELPLSIRSATLEVRPEILKKPGADQLTLKLHLDDVDISILPAFIDRGIVERVNKELEARHVDLSWAFTETLSHVFDLPDALASARALDLCASWGSVKITDEALVLVVSFAARVEPRELEPGSVPAPLARARGVAAVERSPEGARSLWHGSPARLALVGGGALLAGMGISAIVASRQRPRGVLALLHELVT